MKKLIDENGRLFGKISFIDVLVVLAVAAILLVSLTKNDVVEQISGSVQTTPVEYTVIAKNIRVTNAALLREGDYIWLENGVPAGKITGVRTEVATTLSQIADGRYVIGKIESKVDAFVTILADCSYSNGRYYADRTFELNVNQEQKYVTKYEAFTASITEIVPESAR
ncbi:MAG: DUF4330 domain-containing protein [Oscillospiraceae bacterium]|jgi:hypothetical protein|nr:DUF4330 domain-containing protein [Oscillospiraceae bacterium]